jgi:hypothetical protein
MYTFKINKWGVTVYNGMTITCLIDNDFSEIAKHGYNSAIEYCKAVFKSGVK